MRKIKTLNTLISSDIYGITSEEHSLGRSNIEVCKQMLQAGVKIIQYREKYKSAREMYNECIAIQRLARAYDAIFIVNDRVDLAMAVAADGVHIGQEDLPVAVVRRMIDEQMLLGLSTNLPEQAHMAVREGGVDYIGVGPVFSTETKKDASIPCGLEYVKYTAKNVNLPIVAIGGINAGNIAEVKKSGATCFAVISAIVGQPDIEAAVLALRDAITSI